MWSVEYVQVPIEEKSYKDTPNETSGTLTKNTTSPTSQLPRQLSCDSYSLQQNSAIERLQEFREPNLVDLNLSLDSESNMTRNLGAEKKTRNSVNIEREESVTSETSSVSDLYRTCYNDDVIPDDQPSVRSTDLCIDTAVEAYDEMTKSNISGM